MQSEPYGSVVPSSSGDERNRKLQCQESVSSVAKLSDCIELSPSLNPLLHSWTWYLFDPQYCDVSAVVVQNGISLSRDVCVLLFSSGYTGTFGSHRAECRTKSFRDKIYPDKIFLGNMGLFKQLSHPSQLYKNRSKLVRIPFVRVHFVRQSSQLYMRARSRAVRAMR